MCFIGVLLDVYLPPEAHNSDKNKYVVRRTLVPALPNEGIDERNTWCDQRWPMTNLQLHSHILTLRFLTRTKYIPLMADQLWIPWCRPNLLAGTLVNFQDFDVNLINDQE
jgi:hypothetical protein